MEVRKTCPFGHKCEVAKDGYIERCMMYVSYPMIVVATQEVEEIFDCSLNWSGIFARESAQTNRGQTAAIESFRNESVKSQKQFNAIVEESIGIGRNGTKKHIEYDG